jgi:hypothetical protein
MHLDLRGLADISDMSLGFALISASFRAHAAICARFPVHAFRATLHRHNFQPNYAELNDYIKICTVLT